MRQRGEADLWDRGRVLFEATLDLTKTERLKPGLSRSNFHLNLAYLWRVGGNGRFEVQFQRLAQIGESLLFGLALTGHIHLQALGDKPVSLAPDGGGERTLHRTILPQASRPRHGWSQRC